MSKYRDKSDFEMNLCVAQIIFTDSEYDVIKQSMEVVKFQNGNGKGTCHAFDPCNKPADAMPIVIEYGISIMANWGRDGEWAATYRLSIYAENNENPLRAAMEIFLMMKEAENEANT